MAYKVEHAPEAIADDAICLYHPSKRASAVCAGSGDYICTLCAIEVDGKIYGAHYLSSAGKATANKAFDNRLPRPDAEIIAACFLSMPFWFASPLTVTYGIWRLTQAVNLRKTNPLYANLVSSTRLAVLGLLLCVIGFGTIAMFIGIIIAVLSRH